MDHQNEDLLSIRENVEALDSQLLEMLATRRKLSERIAHFKRASGASVRNFPVEQTRLGLLIEKGGELGLDPFSVSRFYQNIIEDSVLTQHGHLHHLENLKAFQEKPRVVYLGGPGAYSQFAARKYFSFTRHPIEEIGAPSFTEALEALEAGRADYAILPYINSTTGLITETVEALLPFEGQAVGEVYLPIDHCLLGQNRDYPVADIRTIYAHPQVLTQCRGYLKGLKNVTLVPLESTHHALKRVAEGRVNEAAIGSAVAGNIFNLKTLKSNLLGDQQNFTRFLVLAKEAHRVSKAVEAKTTIVFSPAGLASDLSPFLLEFHDREIPVLSVESMPSGGAWEKVYLLDISGQKSDLRVGAALEVLQDRTAFLKVIGSYPSGKITSFFSA